MSIRGVVARGALWTISTSIGSRGLGIAGTLVLTRFLSPAAYGEAQVAVVLVLTAHQLSSFGLGQFIAAKPQAGAAQVFRAAALHLGIGLAVLAALVLLRGTIGPHFGSSAVAHYIPGLALAILLERAAMIPERVLIRDMQFRPVAVGRMIGELVFTGGSVALAIAGWGGEAIVAGNLLRAVVRVTLLGAWAERSWWKPAAPSRQGYAELLRFGIPLGMADLAQFASRRWDNLVVSGMFGPGVLGVYNLAYNLADIPATQVGEQIADVLLPSFAHLERERMGPALVRAVELLTLVVAPLAVGLGAVAPTLIALAFPPAWAGIAPMLALLSVLSVFRPLGWTVAAYLQVLDRPRLVLAMEIGKIGLLFALMLSLGRLGPLAACAGVGGAFALHAVLSLAVVRRIEGDALRGVFAGPARALAAALPMAGAVVLVRGIAPLGHHLVLQLIVEILVGAVTYLAAAALVARGAVRAVVALLRELRPAPVATVHRTDLLTAARGGD